ncbi:hypothetical protein K470DRAFT_256407 [Piedraia hortae CBS 480.64]|uniref:Swi5-domain-containing protein n=1 Tax=Piedraia hortae CBS 480.64 TaxID=1314780 RepID=A0A6A7C2X3_9PEZI|nr:hypothetical protein K470DRAFT_256407 [Piedraia hortae CBS 480.64]
MDALLAKQTKLEDTLFDLKSQQAGLVAQVKGLLGMDLSQDSSVEDEVVERANAVIKDHIARLKKYNEIKDIAQGLIGLIAEQRGVRIADVMADFDFEAD